MVLSTLVRTPFAPELSRILLLAFEPASVIDPPPCRVAEFSITMSVKFPPFAKDQSAWLSMLPLKNTSLSLVRLTFPTTDRSFSVAEFVPSNSIDPSPIERSVPPVISVLPLRVTVDPASASIVPPVLFVSPATIRRLPPAEARKTPSLIVASVPVRGSIVSDPVLSLASTRPPAWLMNCRVLTPI